MAHGSSDHGSYSAPPDHSGPHGGPHGGSHGAPHDHGLAHAVEFFGAMHAAEMVVGYSVGHSQAYHGVALTDHGTFDHHGHHLGHHGPGHGIYGQGWVRNAISGWDDGRSARLEAAMLQSDAIVFHRAFMRIWGEKVLLTIFDQLCHQVGLVRLSDTPNYMGENQPNSATGDRLAPRIESWDFAAPNSKVMPSGYLKGIRGSTERSVVFYGLPVHRDYPTILRTIARRLLGRFGRLPNRDRYIRERAGLFPLCWTYALYNKRRVLTPVDQEVKYAMMFQADYGAQGIAYPTSMESDDHMRLLKAAFAEVFRRFWEVTSHLPTEEQVHLRHAYMTMFGLKGPWHAEGVVPWDANEVSHLQDARMIKEILTDMAAVGWAGLFTTAASPTGLPGVGQFPVDLAGSEPGSDPIAVPGPEL